MNNPPTPPRPEVKPTPLTDEMEFEHDFGPPSRTEMRKIVWADDARSLERQLSDRAQLLSEKDREAKMALAASYAVFDQITQSLTAERDKAAAEVARLRRKLIMNQLDD